MGKVKDEAPAKTAKAAPKGTPQRKPNRFLPFFANFLQFNVFKPTQGKNARLWTGIGLGALIGAGIYRYYELSLNEFAPAARFSIAAALALAFGWIIWRLIQFPPFADFLIATEAEMRKVSWTSGEQLYRATLVVLATIFVMAFYLFAVDYLWSWLLQLIGVLKISSAAFGSQAG